MRHHQANDHFLSWEAQNKKRERGRKTFKERIAQNFPNLGGERERDSVTESSKDPKQYQTKEVYSETHDNQNVRSQRQGRIERHRVAEWIKNKM